MSKGKIVVVGANQGALAFACFAKEGGYDVTVYEKKQRYEVAYDWSDDMVASTFEKIGVERPPKVIDCQKPGVTLISPQKTGSATINESDREIDIPVDRHQLNDLLFKRATADGVTFFYNTEVENVLTENDRVIGIELSDGEKAYADMTVDCGGCNSKVRRSLPDFFNIPQELNPEDAFFVRRTFFNWREDHKDYNEGRKIYLKHMGERGISWCFPSHDGEKADVLIGRIGGLSEESYEKALADMKNEVPIIGDTVIFGGQDLIIPVRHAISRMVANGYALAGDSAYITIPMIGSGMAYSLRAAKILADVILKPVEHPFDIKNLYRYQRYYMEEIGAGDCAVELIKNWALTSDGDDIDFIMTKVLTPTILQATSGEMDKMPLTEIIKAVYGALHRPALIVKLSKLFIKMGRFTKIAGAMPKYYNEEEFKVWQKEYDDAAIL